MYSDTSCHRLQLQLLPDTDAHVLVVRANGCDVTLDLADPHARAAGGTHIAELAKPRHLYYGGFWKKKKINNKALEE